MLYVLNKTKNVNTIIDTKNTVSKSSMRKVSFEFSFLSPVFSIELFILNILKVKVTRDNNVIVKKRTQ